MQSGQENLKMFEFMYNANGKNCSLKGDKSLADLRRLVNYNTARNAFSKKILDLHLLYHSCFFMGK